MLLCLTGTAAAEAQQAPVQGPPQSPPARTAREAAARAQELVDPTPTCKPADDGSITVCGQGEEPGRLSPAERAIAGVGRGTFNGIPQVRVNAMTLDKLPYNWMSLGGRLGRPVEHNPLYELAKRATDPDSAPPPDPVSPE